MSMDRNRRQYVGLWLMILMLALGVSACSGGEGQRAGAAGAAPQAEITAGELHERLQSAGEKPLVVDVREPDEFEAGHIAGAQLAPLATVAEDLRSVDRNREIVLVCRSGNRSGKAQRALAARGFTSMRNMTGGMIAWEKRGYPVVK
jgi:rhodanese-related sulfurtransferase